MLRYVLLVFSRYQMVLSTVVHLTVSEEGGRNVAARKHLNEFITLKRRADGSDFVTVIVTLEFL